MCLRTIVSPKRKSGKWRWKCAVNFVLSNFSYSKFSYSYFSFAKHLHGVSFFSEASIARWVDSQHSKDFKIGNTCLYTLFKRNVYEYYTELIFYWKYYFQSFSLRQPCWLQFWLIFFINIQSVIFTHFCNINQVRSPISITVWNCFVPYYKGISNLVAQSDLLHGR